MKGYALNKMCMSFNDANRAEFLAGQGPAGRRGGRLQRPRLNFFLDKLPTFAIGAAAEYQTADEGWNIPTVRPFPGDPALSWHVINSVVAADCDVTMRQEMVVDHAVCNPMQLLWPGGAPWPVRIVPVEINTVQFPLPSAARCYVFGQAIGRPIASYPSGERVVVIGTGGLSHQLDGERALFINKEFAQKFMASSWSRPAVRASGSSCG